MLGERLEDELPEVVYPLLQALAPHYLRPISAMTLIRFTPKKALREALVIPRGTAIHSVPVAEAACPFLTSRDVVLVPLRIQQATLREQNANHSVLRVEFASNMPLEDLPADALRISFTGSYADASQRLMVLCTCLQEIRLIPGSDGSMLRLPATSFRPGGFAEHEALLPYSDVSFSGFRHLQEYYTLPEQFCSFFLSGFDSWTTRGTSGTFAVEFVLQSIPEQCPEYKTEHLELFVTPAVNLFPHAGDPIALDHRQSSYRVRPGGRDKAQYQVYAVDAVREITQGTMTGRKYRPFLAAAREAYAGSGEIGSRESAALAARIIQLNPKALPQMNA